MGWSKRTYRQLSGILLLPVLGVLRWRMLRDYPSTLLCGASAVRVYLKEVEANLRGWRRAKSGMKRNRFTLPSPHSCFATPNQSFGMTPMLRRSLLITAVVVTAGTLAPSLPTRAGADPGGFINNLGNQLQSVTRNASPEQKLTAFRELFHQDFDETRCPGVA